MDSGHVSLLSIVILSGSIKLTAILPVNTWKWHYVTDGCDVSKLRVMFQKITYLFWETHAEAYTSDSLLHS